VAKKQSSADRSGLAKLNGLKAALFASDAGPHDTVRPGSRPVFRQLMPKQLQCKLAWIFLQPEKLAGRRGRCGWVARNVL